MKTPEADNDPRPRSISAIVLAAGRSRRMGRPKQLLPLSGKDNVIQVVTRLIRPLVRHVVVVVGHVGGQVAASLADQDITLAINTDVDRGMLSSVQVGIRAVPEPCEGYLICLGDQPSLHAAVIDAVLHNAAAGVGIVMPTYDGKRGHPVFIHRRYREEILALDPETTGLNAVTRSHEAETVEVAWSDARILDDMDTPTDYAREFERAGLVN
ncbi:MAG: nucleotidyltransferase family protein [bacterium]|nr:nucleotidyltransferase family protein [bacterium]